MTEPLDEWIREERVKIARDAIDRSFDSSMSLLKWALTSVAVFHSAAFIAGFNSKTISQIMFEGPAWMFLAGIGLALFGGLVLAIGAAQIGGAMTNSLWRGEGLDTENNEAFNPKPTISFYIGAALLGLSISAFLVGAKEAISALDQSIALEAKEVDPTK